MPAIKSQEIKLTEAVKLTADINGDMLFQDLFNSTPLTLSELKAGPGITLPITSYNNINPSIIFSTAANSSSSVHGLIDIYNASSGYGQSITVAGDGIGLGIDSTLGNNNTVGLSINAVGLGLDISMTGAGYGTGMRINTTGTNSGLEINSNSTYPGLVVNNISTGQGLQITNATGTSVFSIDGSGVPTISALAGTGDRTIGVDSVGRIKTGYQVGIAANNLVQLDGTGRLPAVDGSQLTGITSTQITGFSSMIYPSSGIAVSNGTAWNTSLQVGIAANNLVQLDGTGRLPAVDGSQLTGITSTQITGFSSNINTSTVTAEGDVILTGVNKAVYFGDPAVSGTIRIIKVGANLEVQVNNSGTWTMIQRILS
jgi:hypothetical protein